MKIYIVSDQKQEANRCGEYKGFYCYLVDFIDYHHHRIKGIVFTKAKIALNYMIRNAK